MQRLLSGLLLLCLCLPAVADEKAVGQLLDDFHQAASQADGARYFGHFMPDGVFLGTDASERWTVAQFKAYAEPHFSKGRGWTYRSTARHVSVSPDGNTAWFDEMLSNDNYGVTRGSGVLQKIDGTWKIAQYNLSFPVPNGLLKNVVEMIRQQP